MGLSERFMLDSSRPPLPSLIFWGVACPYPVSENARPGVGGLDLVDVGKVNLFGKDEEQQTLHSNRCDLMKQTKKKNNNFQTHTTCKDLQNIPIINTLVW